VNVQQNGFAKAKREVQLTVGSAFDISFVLSIEAENTAVEVTDQPPIVEQTRSQIGPTVSESEATNLPFNGRNDLDLALLVPGVSPTNTSSVQTFAETSPVLGQG